MSGDHAPHSPRSRQTETTCRRDAQARDGKEADTISTTDGAARAYWRATAEKWLLGICAVVAALFAGEGANQAAGRQLADEVSAASMQVIIAGSRSSSADEATIKTESR